MRILNLNVVIFCGIRSVIKKVTLFTGNRSSAYKQQLCTSISTPCTISRRAYSAPGSHTAFFWRQHSCGCCIKEVVESRTLWHCRKGGCSFPLLGKSRRENNVMIIFPSTNQNRLHKYRMCKVRTTVPQDQVLHSLTVIKLTLSRTLLVAGSACAIYCHPRRNPIPKRYIATYLRHV